jgi:nucleoside-triphosphatase
MFTQRIFLGTGKTTLIKRACENYIRQNERIRCYGFYTEEVRGNNGLRIGFDVVTLDGKSRSPLARIK